MVLVLWAKCTTVLLKHNLGGRTLFVIFLSPATSGLFEPVVLVLWVNCFTTVLQEHKQVIEHFLTIVSPVQMAGFKPLIIGL